MFAWAGVLSLWRPSHSRQFRGADVSRNLPNIPRTVDANSGGSAVQRRVPVADQHAGPPPRHAAQAAQPPPARPDSRPSAASRATTASPGPGPPAPRCSTKSRSCGSVTPSLPSPCVGEGSESSPGEPVSASDGASVPRPAVSPPSRGPGWPASRDRMRRMISASKRSSPIRQVSGRSRSPATMRRMTGGRAELSVAAICVKASSTTAIAWLSPRHAAATAPATESVHSGNFVPDPRTRRTSPAPCAATPAPGRVGPALGDLGKDSIGRPRLGDRSRVSSMARWRCATPRPRPGGPGRAGGRRGCCSPRRSFRVTECANSTPACTSSARRRPAVALRDDGELIAGRGRQRPVPDPSLTARLSL